eukprot:TRINITY_DN2228_c0_g1_i1.p1 TRINITY_DN2228_c0_g1~~TRINITY_DN2228_c0_g1_i1.p1  ORF type:complete len:1034 (+),score=279.92 TRINITY_DN2228_c0_g1_i1:363-3104(+)
MPADNPFMPTRPAPPPPSTPAAAEPLPPQRPPPRPASQPPAHVPSIQLPPPPQHHAPTPPSHTATPVPSSSSSTSSSVPSIPRISPRGPAPTPGYAPVSAPAPAAAVGTSSVPPRVSPRGGVALPLAPTTANAPSGANAAPSGVPRISPRGSAPPSGVAPGAVPVLPTLPSQVKAQQISPRGTAPQQPQLPAPQISPRGGATAPAVSRPLPAPAPQTHATLPPPQAPADNPFMPTRPRTTSTGSSEVAPAPSLPPKPAHANTTNVPRMHVAPMPAKSGGAAPSVSLAKPTPAPSASGGKGQSPNSARASLPMTADQLSAAAVSMQKRPKDYASDVLGERGVIPADLPHRRLCDPAFLCDPASLHMTELVHKVDFVNLFRVSPLNKILVLSEATVSFYKTNMDEVLGLYFTTEDPDVTFSLFTSLAERPVFSPYSLHYVFPHLEGMAFPEATPEEGVVVEPHFMWMLQLPFRIEKEEVDKVEVLILYYSCMFRIVRPFPGEGEEKEADVDDVRASKIEKGSMVVANGFVSAGQGVGKAAHSISGLYQKKTKSYEGPDMTEEEMAAMQEAEDAKAESGSSKFVRGTAAVAGGVKSGFKWVGSTTAKGVKSTSWYKEKEEKERREKEERERQGLKDEKEGKKKVLGSGVNAVMNVVGGIEKGIVVGASGVRDASVDATRHRSGDKAAMQSRSRWNTAGNIVVSTVNIASLVSVTWIKGALYAGMGAVGYDPNAAQYTSGASWKEGWVRVQKDILAGAGWDYRWAVLRSSGLAFYRSPEEVERNNHDFFYKIPDVRKATKAYLTQNVKKTASTTTVGGNTVKTTSTVTTESAVPVAADADAPTSIFFISTVDSMNYFDAATPDVDYITGGHLAPDPVHEAESWIAAVSYLALLQMPPLASFEYNGVEIPTKKPGTKK